MLDINDIKAVTA